LKNSEVQSSDILSSEIKFLMMISWENTVIWMFLIENLEKMESAEFFSRL
jgi:hypothetical protein